MRVHTHAPGPAGHGVVRHARSVAELCAAHGVLATEHGPDLTHAHFTDALFGRTIEAAARNYRAWAARAPRPLVVTVHDVPDPAARDRRNLARCAGYAAVLDAGDAVIVSAEHEAAKVAHLTGRPVQHIDLPLPAAPRQNSGQVPPGVRSSLVVLGYLYPGKGHREAIDAAATVGRNRPEGPPGVLAAGAVSDGHADLAEELAAHAAARRVPFAVTGRLSGARFAAVARAAGVPLVLNREVSASGSLLSWLSCRRRPVTLAGPYSREIDCRYPDNLTLAATPADLAELTARALADPSETRLADRPQWPDTGAEHLALYRRVLVANRIAPCSPTS